jgi:type II secretory pathway pseudopilin PulG
MLRRVASSHRAGFTTIESLVAAVVFLVGLAGLLGALVHARGATGQARRLMQATDVANDLAEQIQMWDFNDPRLAASPAECAEDPMDASGKLFKPGTSDYTAYRACMHGELMLTLGGATYGGLANPVFTDESNVQTRYDRFYIVRVQDVREGVQRKQVWIKVLYRDAGEPRVVTTQTLRIYMGGI